MGDTAFHDVQGGGNCARRHRLERREPDPGRGRDALRGMATGALFHSASNPDTRAPGPGHALDPRASSPGSKCPALAELAGSAPWPKLFPDSPPRAERAASLPPCNCVKQHRVVEFLPAIQARWAPSSFYPHYIDRVQQI